MRKQIRQILFNVDRYFPSLFSKQPTGHLVTSGAVKHFLRVMLFLREGALSNCHNTNANASALGGIYGYSHIVGGYYGGQAEYIRVPFADVGPTKWMDEEDTVLLTDACPTGYFAAELGDIKGRGPSAQGNIEKRNGLGIRSGMCHCGRPLGGYVSPGVRRTVAPAMTQSELNRSATLR